MLKRKFGQTTTSPRDTGSRANEYPNDSHFRRTKRLKESEEYGGVSSSFGSTVASG